MFPAAPEPARRAMLAAMTFGRLRRTAAAAALVATAAFGYRFWPATADEGNEGWAPPVWGAGSELVFVLLADDPGWTSEWDARGRPGILPSRASPMRRRQSPKRSRSHLIGPYLGEERMAEAAWQPIPAAVVWRWETEPGAAGVRHLLDIAWPIGDVLEDPDLRFAFSGEECAGAPTAVCDAAGCGLRKPAEGPAARP